MSREIDERVVQMNFENGQFERNIKDSISSLDSLKKNLNFADAIHGFDGLDKAVKGVNINVLGKAVEEVRVKFSMLEVLGLRVMTRISDAAIDAGEKLVKSLTIDQITPGWDKYAQKTTAVQTIMSATANQFSDTAVQMEYVSSQLEKLNWFTDETSYNFVDMVDNIGKFTSNNISLDKSVTAMQGIANWAAISGQNATAASRAMYNLAQALSMDAVTVKDWMSIENANMATAGFKEIAIEAGLAAGTLIKAGDKIVTATKKTEVSVSSFRETLAEKWFTGDVLMAALDKYGAATNTLNELYEALGGRVTTSDIVSGINDYIGVLDIARLKVEEMGLEGEDANKKISESTSEMAKTIADDWGISLELATEWLNKFDDEAMQFGLKAFEAGQEAKTFSEALDSVKDAISTGWMKSFEYIFGDYTEAKEFWTDIANELYDIFAESGNLRNDMLKAWKGMGGRDVFIDSIWAGLSAILRILGPIKAAWNDTFGITAESLFSATNKLRDFLISLNITEDTMSKIYSTAQIIISPISILVSLIKSAATAFGSLIGHFIPFGNGLLTVTANIGDFLHDLDETIKQTKIFDQVFGKLASVIIFGADGIFGAFKLIGNGFKTLTGVSDFSELTSSISNLVHNGFERFIAVGRVFYNVLSIIVKSIKSAIPSANDLRDSILDVFKAFSNPFSESSFTEALNVLNAGLFASLILTIKKFMNTFSKFLDPLQIKKSFGVISDIAKELGSTLEDLRVNLKLESLKSIATSMLILAGALAILASLDSEKLGSAIVASIAMLSELFSMLVAMQNSLDAKSVRAISKTGLLMIEISVAITILASAMKKIGSLEWDGVAKGLASVYVLMEELIDSIKKLGTESPIVVKGAFSIILFAEAINILSSAVLKLSSLGFDQLLSGLVGVGTLMVELSVFISSLTKQFSVKTGIGLIGLATAIIIFVSAVQKLSKLDADSIIPGLLSLGIVMMEIAVFVNKLGSSGNMLSAASSVLLLSFAISGFTKAVNTLGNIDLDNLISGLFGLLSILATVTITLNKMPTDTIGKGAGLVILSTGILLLTKALENLSNIEGFIPALIILGVALKEITDASNKMNESVKSAASMLVFAVAINTLALGLKSLGSLNISEILKSLITLTISFKLLTVAASTLGPVIGILTKISIAIGIFSAAVLILGVGITTLSFGLSSLGTSAVIGVGGLVTAMMELIKLIPTIAAAIAQGIVAFATVITNGAPAIVKAVSTLIIATLEEIAMLAPQIVDLVIDIIMSVAQAIADRSDDLKAAGKLLFGSFSEGVASGIADIVTAVALLIPSLTGAMKLLGGAKGMEKGAMSTLFAMIAIVAALGLLIIAASHIPIGDVTSALTISAAIAILMPSLAASFAILSKFGNGSKLSNSTVIQFGIISAIAMAVGAAISAIAMIDGSDKALPVVESLAVLMPVLAATFAILTKFSGSISYTAVAQFAIISAIAVAAGAIVAVIGGIPGAENAITIASAIVTLMVPLAAITALLCSPLMIGASAALPALGVLGIIVAVLGAVAIALGALMQNSQVKQVLSDGAEGMMLLGNAIGGFVGGIIGGLVGGVTSFLPTLGTYLSEFMENAQPFFDNAKNIPDGLGANIKNVAEALLALTKAELLNGIANFASSIFGEGGTDVVGRFTSFGEAINGFAAAINDDFDPAKVQAAAEAGKALSELESNLPRQGGKLQEWIGTKDLGAFGDRLKIFGEAIVEFAITIGDLNAEAVEKASTAASTLVELENNLPKQGGVLQSFLGNSSFENFGPGLVALGSGLKSFSDTIVDVSESRILTASTCVGILVNLENSIEKSGGWGEIFTGKSDFTSFGNNIKSLGSSLKIFSDSLIGIDFSKLGSAIDYIRDLVGLRGIGSLKSDIIGSVQGILNDIRSTIDSNGTLMQTEGSSLIKWISQGLNNGSDIYGKLALKTLSTFISDIRTSIDKYESSMKSKGAEIIGWIAKGFEQGTNSYAVLAQNAAIKLANDFVLSFEQAMKIHSPSLVMNEEGHWTVQGLAEGINEDTSAEEAMRQKAQNIVSAFDSEISKLGTRATTLELEKQLWDLTDGKIAAGMSVAEQQAISNQAMEKEIEIDRQKLADLARTVGLRQAELDAIAEVSGVGSEEYEKAYQTLIQARINMETLRQEMEEKYNQTNAASANSWATNAKAIADFQKEYAETYEFLGKTKDDLRRDAYKSVLGYTDEDIDKMDRYNSIMAEGTDEVFQMLGKSREEYDEYAKEISGWSGLYADQAKTVVDTNKIISDNIATATVDMAASIEKANADAIKKATGGGSAGSAAAAAGGAGLADTLSESYTNELMVNMDSDSIEIDKKGRSILTDTHDTLENISSYRAKQTAKKTASSYNEGIVEESDSVTNAVNTGIIQPATSELEAGAIQSEPLGKSFTQGFVRGMTSKTMQGSVKSGALLVVDLALNTIKERQNSNSPSKVTMGFGNDFTDGFAIGIRQNLQDVESSSLVAANTAINSMDYAMGAIDTILSSDEDFQPVITPVLDLDQIKAQAAQIPSLITQTSGIKVTGLSAQLSNIAAGSKSKSSGSSSGGGNQNGTGTSSVEYNFTQNNYSPKALSRTEIYRQTNNQFSKLKEATKG